MDALVIRNRILNYFSEGRPNLKIIIGGAGSTGVELAGEIQCWAGELKTETRPCEIKTTIVEAAPTILPGFDNRVIALANQRLKELKIDVLVNEVIDSVSPNQITLKSGRRLSGDILIWTGGVKVSGLTKNLPLKRDAARKQVLAEAGMECLPATPDLKLYGKIYALGDAVCFYDPITQKAIPKVARAALIQATVVAHNVIEDIRVKEGSAGKGHFTYQSQTYPYVTPIGGKYAIAKIGSWVVSGKMGWILKLLVELNYLLSIMKVRKALLTWFKGIRVFIKNDRLG